MFTTLLLSAILAAPATASTSASAPCFDGSRTRMLPDDALAERVTLDLSGPWSFLADRKNEGVAAGYFAKTLDTSSWRPVTVPVAFDQCGADMDRYTGVGWYRRIIDIPEAMRSRRVVLQFQGINYNATVWVNGKQVGENHDAFLPFEIPVSDAIRYGEKNLIAVRVDNIRQRGQFPLFEGWQGQGGFLREAALVAGDPLYITQVAIQAEPHAAGGRLTLKASVSNQRSASARIQLRAELEDGSGRNVGLFRSSSAELKSGDWGELEINAVVADAKPWSPEQPVLYQARVYLLATDQPADAVMVRFGFRKVEIRDARICLNGKPVFLMGFNRHEDSPRTGMAVDLQQARADFTDMKQIGCNYVRFCHYPHHPGELDLCDELGLLVMIESSMNTWGHVDHPDPNGGFALTPKDAPRVVENGKRTLRKMIQRDRNHPSIILCSVGNESVEDHPDVVAGNSELIEYGRGLDPTRLWTHVSNSYRMRGFEAFCRSDDVITINCYPTLDIPVNVNETTLREKFPQSTRFMQELPETLHRLFPDKPILIGEFGFPGGDSGPQGAEIQAVATEAEFKGLTAPYVSGAALWCYARHPWPTAARYGDNQLMSPYGYVSRDRKSRFPALKVVERMYKQRAAQSASDE
jgi:beta-galactosidase/beta-glucuronidase